MKFPYVDGMPVVFVGLLAPDHKPRVRSALLDTGASISMFPASLASSLGIDLSNINPTTARTAKSRAEMTYRPADVVLRMSIAFDRIVSFFEWPSLVGFSSECDEGGVLGHRKCLEYFDVTFFGSEKYVAILPNTSFPGRNLYKRR